MCLALHNGHGALRGLHLALVLLAGNHALEQPVLGLSHLPFGMLDFVLQGFIRFVGFYLEALVAVFARPLLPGVHIHFVFLAVLEAGGEGFLGGGDLLAGLADSRLHGGDLRGNRFQALAQFGQAHV